MPPPCFGSFAAADGQALWYRLTLPRGHDSKTRIPVLVNVYGGPGVQRVRNEWTPLTQSAVRESRHRGIRARQPRRHQSRQIIRRPDPRSPRIRRSRRSARGNRLHRVSRGPIRGRIGVIGHSYGGFMTLMLMAQNDGRIRCGVSTAPVTDWRSVRHALHRAVSVYAANNPDGYRDSCVLSHVDTISGALLLMHGMADDNVLFANTSALMKALQNRGFPFELMLYPGAKHAMQERDVSIHRYQHHSRLSTTESALVNLPHPPRHQGRHRPAGPLQPRDGAGERGQTARPRCD